MLSALASNKAPLWLDRLLPEEAREKSKHKKGVRKALTDESADHLGVNIVTVVYVVGSGIGDIKYHHLWHHTHARPYIGVSKKCNDEYKPEHASNASRRHATPSRLLSAFCMRAP